MITYDFKCPVCGIKSTETQRSLAMFGIPVCDGWTDPYVVADDGVKRSPHVRTEMKRLFHPPNIVWPKEKRGH